MNERNFLHVKSDWGFPMCFTMESVGKLLGGLPIPLKPGFADTLPISLAVFVASKTFNFLGKEVKSVSFTNAYPDKRGEYFIYNAFRAIFVKLRVCPPFGENRNQFLLDELRRSYHLVHVYQETNSILWFCRRAKTTLSGCFWRSGNYQWNTIRCSLIRKISLFRFSGKLQFDR